jgi:UDP-GlcNAc:undecaprenyl-phosphate/decaprenyl-phosphate GlcNAc-1-phosphate transferase
VRLVLQDFLWVLVWFLTATFISASFIAILLKVNRGRYFIDHPSTRSLHSYATPRMGGLAIIICWLITIAIRQPLGWVLLANPVFALTLMSLRDDFVSLPVWSRLSVQCAAVLIWLTQVHTSDPIPLFQIGVSLFIVQGWIVWALVGIVMMWVTNLYNFMDGADGLAGGMTATGFMAYSVASHASGATDIAFISIIVSGAAVGFLFFNFAPARVFMGDAGSIPLGFLAGALGLMGNLQNAWPWWFPPLVFSPFIVDATVTLLKRACQGKKIWIAHREHYYQRLVLMGWSHKRLALTEYVLMLGCAGSALYALQLPAQQLFAGSAISVQHAILIGWCLVYLALGVTLEIVFSRHQNAPSKTT